MTRAETLADYSVDANGIIRSPGKFESEAIFVPHLWDASIDSGELLDGDDPIWSVDITPEDIAEYPELTGFKVAHLWESENGFVYCDLLKGE